MPGLKELNNFRSNLQNIANEADVVAHWKERYEDYPYPENPPLPDVDVDDLLGDIETPSSPEQGAVEGQDIHVPSSSDENDDNLDSIIDGMNNFTDSPFPSDDLGSIDDLPPPDIFSMPTDLDFSNLPSSSEEIEEVQPKKTRNRKIDLDKWNASQEEDVVSDAKSSLHDDFSPSFDEASDEKIEDANTEESFLDEGNVAEEPIVNDIDLSKFDFGDDSEEEIPSSIEDNLPSSIENIGESSSFDDEDPLDVNDGEVEDYPKDEITNDLSAEELSSIDNVQDDASSIDLSQFDPDEFGKIEGDEEIKNADINESDAFATEEPVDSLEPIDTLDDGDNEDGNIEETNKVEEPSDAIEEAQSVEPEVDLTDFEKPSRDEASSFEELKDEGEEPLEVIEDEPSGDISSLSTDELEIPSLDDEKEALPLEEKVLPETEDVQALDEGKVSDEDGIEEIGDAEPIEALDEEAEPIEALDEIPENDGAGENIGDLDVEDVGDSLTPVEDNSDSMLPLSSEELDAMDAEENPGNQDVDLGAFDPIADDVDLYTEPEDEMEELDNSAAAGVAKPKQDVPSEFDSFSNIDISPSGEEANIDEHAAFTISNNILDENISDTVGGFSVPDDYTQFSQDKSSYSSYKGKGKDDENIALSITEDEYQHLLDRISSFPLNVRLEIEDYLAHNDDPTISKMEFVHFIISGASLKKVASKLSEILEKPIPIPKGFERKTAEEYEAEKRTFKYKLRHKIIPFATIAGIALLLTSCICFLFWTFVYIPIVSETIYNKGYTLLEENKYSDAMQEFNNAGEYQKKKRWYFKYANGFRGKKQFQLAEDIYRRLLFDFNHDKKGGLEYVSMLRDDLHNYEKAENVLKRSVLDFHVNDEDALISLGDTYLEWARENPEKYEKARQTYSSLINMYGRKDHFLSRMMKYFIRTDKLGEVLPLKEYFMKHLKKLDIEDLTELGSYLITKRYDTDMEDDDNIKNIDDVRDVLEAPLKRDKDDANANYNMGRFFLYNRKFDVAKHYLAKSIDTYKNTNNLSSGSIMNSIDARRLYGEILSENKEYLQAQEMYADALSSYQEYSNSRLTSPNKIVGKLYSDYADINYFISGDLNKALQAYTMATNQMNDTPSIKYRIGYIYYQNKNYEDAMKYLSLVHTEKKDDKNLLYGLGNTLYKRGSYYVAQAYYERLMEMLEAEKIRKHILLPHSRPDHNAFIDEYMRTTNNLGVILNKLAMQDGSSEKNGRAMALLGESSRAWDALTRNPETMVASKAVSLAYLNIQNMIKPQTAFETEIYSDIPKTLENERVLAKEMDR
jgi:hypothetical protein